MVSKDDVADTMARLRYRKETPSIIVEHMNDKALSVLYTLTLEDPEFAARELGKLLNQISESNSIHCRVGTRVIMPNGQVLVDIHSINLCASYACSIHHPSQHLMVGMLQVYDFDKKLMQRVCNHGVKHPDPDDRALHLRSKDGFDLSHTCCSKHCCQPPVISERKMLRGELPDAE